MFDSDDSSLTPSAKGKQDNPKPSAVGCKENSSSSNGIDLSFDTDDNNNDDVFASSDNKSIELVAVSLKEWDDDKENNDNKTNNKENDATVATLVEKKNESGKDMCGKERNDDRNKCPSTIPLSVKETKKGKSDSLPWAKKKGKGKGDLDDPFTLEVVKCFAASSKKNEST